MSKLRAKSLALSCAALALAASGGLAVQQAIAQATAAAEAGAFKAAARRITESQYRNTIKAAFGADILVNARFEPEKRNHGLQAIGSADLSITTSGLEQYFSLARSISDQALGPERREKTVGCKPADPAKFDEACARAFIERYGEALFRRPLTPQETSARLKAAQQGAEGGDFYEGLKLALASLLIAPEFLFRIEVAEPDPANAGKFRLDGFTKAQRLSYLFWDAPPDAELMAAAKSGAIHTKEGLQAQITRLKASPRLEEGARAFFIDMLQFENFDGLSKDATVYPKFSQAVANAAREQTLKTVVELLITQKRDYRDLFSSNETFINRELAAVYNVPYASSEDWMRYTFPAASDRAGILTQVSFLSMFSHPGASSPTKRGVKVQEIFRCAPTPEPPADVDFAKVQALDKGTVRVRLLDHMTNPGCASCHRITDPIGLALEHFDSAGQTRKLENGELIDVSAELNGKKFTGAPGVAAYLREDSRTASCLVRNVYSYGVGRYADFDEAGYLQAQTAAFVAAGYKVPDLFAQIAASPDFFKVVTPKELRRGAPAPKVAALGGHHSQGAVR